MFRLIIIGIAWIVVIIAWIIIIRAWKILRSLKRLRAKYFVELNKRNDK